MSVIDLTKYDWKWNCWRPWAWKLRTTMELNTTIKPEFEPIDALVPGTVQKSLLNAEMLEDWCIQRNSLKCEWVENRHWELFTRISLKDLEEQTEIKLYAESLDYSGWVLIDNKIVGEFKGALLPHEFDLSDYITDDKEHLLRIIFDCLPEEQGQFGFTSKSHFFKPRYNYSWDWCPRFVPIGISGQIKILTGIDSSFELRTVRTELEGDLSAGRVYLHYENLGTSAQNLIRISVLDGGDTIYSSDQALGKGSNEIWIENLQVQPWYPNGLGDPKIYALNVEIVDVHGEVITRRIKKIGFKNIKWLPCEGATDDALPWICQVNGKPIFLQGFNWTPVLMNYQDTSQEDYSRLLTQYADMGCNLLRVWGGAYLETESFYDLCDELGLMVWQEFPLSSSGCDNTPPSDDAVIEGLLNIAHSYIERRSHYASLLMWCGGNELQKANEFCPALETDICLYKLNELVAKEDPSHRFVHTSPSGPIAIADRTMLGKGIVHDVHGPWTWAGFDSMKDWEEYWDADDSLFRSEVGMQGACDEEFIYRYCQDDFWPPSNKTWSHSSSWYVFLNQYQDLLEKEPHEALRLYIIKTQKEQAEALRIAAESTKNRFPRCGGIFFWMGHDCFPCPINLSVIDFEGNPKPAVDALKKVFCSSSSITR